MSEHDIRLDHLKKIGMQIGKGTYIFSDNLEGNEPYLIKIGNNCIIAAGVTLLTHDASACYFSSKIRDLFGFIEIGNNVFIGVNATIMPGVTISDDCIIGAGSVVTKSVREPGSVIAGNPAKKICTIDDMREKYKDVSLNPAGMSFIEKRDYLLKHKDLMVKK